LAFGKAEAVSNRSNGNQCQYSFCRPPLFAFAFAIAFAFAFALAFAFAFAFALAVGDLIRGDDDCCSLTLLPLLLLPLLPLLPLPLLLLLPLLSSQS
jgi:hypothetical protein